MDFGRTHAVQQVNHEVDTSLETRPYVAIASQFLKEKATTWKHLYNLAFFVGGVVVLAKWGDLFVL